MQMQTLAISLALLGLGAAAQAAEHQVLIQNSQYIPEEINIEVGDTVTWINQDVGMPHNVHADDDSFRCATSCSGAGGGPSSSGWTASVTFNTAGDIGYYCDAHGGPGGVGMSGMVKVAAAEPVFFINNGLNGAWYDPASSGQGFLVEMVPSFAPPLLTIAWYTYNSTAGGPESQRWFTMLGNVTVDSNSVSMAVYRTTGSPFASGNPPANTVQVGTATAHFETCTSGSLDYSIDLGVEGAPDPQAGTIPLSRLTPDIYCESIINPPATLMPLEAPEPPGNSPGY